MKRLPTLFALLGFLVTSASWGETPLPSVLRLDSIGFASFEHFEADARTVTEVSVHGDYLYVTFVGKWRPSFAKSSSDAVKYDFTIVREKDVSQAAWEAL